MGQTVTPTSNAVALAKAEENQILKIDSVLTDFRSEVGRVDVGEFQKAILQVRAMKLLRELIDDSIMDDVMELMNTQMGFKTDRNPAQFGRDGKRNTPYDRETVKNAVIVAFLSGARAIGNQFNIIAGNCYLTKEFTHQAIVRFPGLSELSYQIGDITRFGEKAAKAEAYASYSVYGKPYEIVCRKSEVMDLRLVVNCYANSSPDEVRGRAEAKLFRQILSRLTGLNLDPEEGEELTDAGSADGDEETKTITGSVNNGASRIVSTPEPVRVAVSPVTDSAAAKNLLSAFIEQLNECSAISEVKRIFSDRKLLIESTAWSDDLKLATIDAMDEHAAGAIQWIRDQRGEGSNR